MMIGIINYKCSKYNKTLKVANREGSVLSKFVNILIRKIKLYMRAEPRTHHTNTNTNTTKYSIFYNFFFLIIIYLLLETLTLMVLRWPFLAPPDEETDTFGAPDLKKE